MKPSDPNHWLHIKESELTPELRVKIREISSRKHSNYKIAFASIISALIAVGGAVVIRHFELQQMRDNNPNCVISKPVRKAFTTMQKDITFMANELESNHNLCRRMWENVSDIKRAVVGSE